MRFKVTIEVFDDDDVEPHHRVEKTEEGELGIALASALAGICVDGDPMLEREVASMLWRMAMDTPLLNSVGEIASQLWRDGYYAKKLNEVAAILVLRDFMPDPLYGAIAVDELQVGTILCAICKEMKMPNVFSFANIETICDTCRWNDELEDK